MARNGVIGRDGGLPWRLPDDLRRFKAITMGKPMLMGRTTFISLGRPLPGRENIVLTRDRGWTADGVRVVHSLDEAVATASDAAELMVIGGAEIYRLAWSRLERLELTEVHGTVEGDTRLDLLDPAEWRETSRELHPADERHALAFSFVTLQRRGA